MKKFTLVMSAILMAVLLAFSAAAAEEFMADANKAFDITYTGTEGQYYAIVIVEGLVEEGDAPSITEDSIQYIDQQTAGEGGVVSFEDVLLKVDGTQATVFLGGSDLDEPVLLGWVNKTVEATTFTVSGTVTSDSDSEAKVTLTCGENVFEVNTVNGVYEVAVPVGTYTLVAEKAKHLSYTKTALEVMDGNVEQNAKLLGGELEIDGTVNFDDLSIVLLYYRQNVEEADVDGTGTVDFDDLSIILLNYRKSAIAE